MIDTRQVTVLWSKSGQEANKHISQNYIYFYDCATVPNGKLEMYCTLLQSHFPVIQPDVFDIFGNLDFLPPTYNKLPGARCIHNTKL